MNNLLILGLMGLLAGATAQTDEYIAFVVDDTGSMGVEISAVKTWINNCLAGTHPFCTPSVPGVGTAHNIHWILQTFNDPDIGAIVGPTTDPADISTALTSVTAHGGGDCPELSASGQINAGSVVPCEHDGCRVFVFTDASAKDAYLEDAVYNLYINKDCAVYPILSGCCDGPCVDPCPLDPDFCDIIEDLRSGSSSGGTGTVPPSLASLPAAAARVASVDAVRPPAGGSTGERGEFFYYRLANRTGGRTFILDKPTSPSAFVELLDTRILGRACPTKMIAGPGRRGYATQRDCELQGACWDVTAGRCYCQSADDCPSEPVCQESEKLRALPSPTDCSQYIVISGGLQTKTCPEGQVFDRRCRFCNYRHYVAPPCGTYRPRS